MKPVFRIEQNGRIRKTIYIKNQTSRKSYYLHEFDCITPLPKQQYLILNRYNTNKRCQLTYFIFKILDVLQKKFYKTNILDLCKTSGQIKKADSSHQIIYKQAVQFRGIKADHKSLKLAVLLSKNIISKTEKLRRKHTNASYLLILSRTGEKFYANLRLPEKFNNAQLVGFSNGIVYLGLAKQPYYYLYSTAVNKSIGNTE